jgi:DNA repair protein RadC
MNEQRILQLAEIQISYSNKVKPSEMEKVTTSSDAEKIFRSVWRQSIELKECFYTMYLNRSNKVLGVMLISEGGISGTVVDARNIFQAALKANASGIIIAHNHPSGNTTASDADKQITCKIREAGKTLDITLLDHLIMVSDGYMSFADEGLV